MNTFIHTLTLAQDTAWYAGDYREARRIGRVLRHAQHKAQRPSLKDAAFSAKLRAHFNREDRRWAHFARENGMPVLVIPAMAYSGLSSKKRALFSDLILGLSQAPDDTKNKIRSVSKAKRTARGKNSDATVTRLCRQLGTDTHTLRVVLETYLYAKAPRDYVIEPGSNPDRVVPLSREERAELRRTRRLARRQAETGYGPRVFKSGSPATAPKTRKAAKAQGRRVAKPVVEMSWIEAILHEVIVGLRAEDRAQAKAQRRALRNSTTAPQAPKALVNKAGVKRVGTTVREDGKLIHKAAQFKLGREAFRNDAGYTKAEMKALTAAREEAREIEKAMASKNREERAWAAALRKAVGHRLDWLEFKKRAGVSLEATRITVVLAA